MFIYDILHFTDNNIFLLKLIDWEINIMKNVISINSACENDSDNLNLLKCYNSNFKYFNNLKMIKWMIY